MTESLLCLLALGGALYTLLLWGFRVLPREGWQVAACIPRQRDADGLWSGLNLTWYGFFTATAYVLAVAVLLLLLGSLAVPVWLTLGMVMAVLALCVPASSLVARWVEGKKHTFTVGGASFVGILVAPWIVLGANLAAPSPDWTVPVPAALAAISVSYILGEGIGRLACISFGCCYGKPLYEASPLMRKLFGPFHFTFTGDTKKIAYAHGFQGQPVIPVQGLTSLIYVTAGLGGCFLFIHGRFLASFFLTLLVSQLWRVLSEFLRADYRGERRFSAYQVMALLGVGYGAGLSLWLADVPVPGGASIPAGLAMLWDPAVILFLQVLWLVIFLHTGRSSVTASRISLHVVREKI